MNLPELEAQQAEMAEKVIVPQGQRQNFPAPGAVVVSLDVQYVEQDAYVALDVMRWGSSESKVFTIKESVTEPYYPGLFAFREGPVLLKAIHALEQRERNRPDLLIIDGHGRAHPRKFGVASWLGLKLGIPAIGVAKETLVRFEEMPADAPGSTSPVIVEDETVGYVLRTVAGVKPVFVSPGHLVSLEESRSTVMALVAGYRVIEPIRRADQACRAFAKGESLASGALFTVL